ncbi:MAG: CopG family transcriptional regulator [Acidimicrobiales bacterium]
MVIRRTNVYLSEAEQAALDARAEAEGRSRSEIVRTAIDRELNLAEELAERAGELSADDPGLRID